jgi:hypothetical protein
MWFLKRFNKEELEIIDKTEQYESVRAYLESELNTIEYGTAEFISVEQLDSDLEKTIKI